MPLPTAAETSRDEPLTIGGRTFQSRPMVGTGKSADRDPMAHGVEPSGVQTIKRRLHVPVIVDAGVGTASDACVTMEQGVDGILMNTAIAAAQDPVAMAHAMRLATIAGRAAFLAGRMQRREVAMPSSPTKGMLD